jgi:ABC-type branched-subunit amino acid transport system substrate-binding protein
MPNKLLPIVALASAALACCWCGSLRAQGVPGVTSKEILIGSCSALEGPSHALGTQQIKGAQAYFSLINQEGGVEGRKLRLLAYDDSYDPVKTEACFKRLESQNVFAMGFFVGTPTAVKYLPMAEEAKIPIVGLFTGAQTLYAPLRRWIINVRASYGEETREQIEGLWTGLGYRKIAIICPNDAFGTTVLEGVKAALQSKGAEPVAVGTYVRQTTEAGVAIHTVRAKNPQAVVIVGPANTVGPIVKKVHSMGWKPQFVTVSFVGTDDLISEAGADAEGMVVTQVVPPYYLTDLKTVALYRKTFAKYEPGQEPGFVSLEGFVDAMVLVEGLKRAGKELSREGLIRGIESIHQMDVGLGQGLFLNYSARDHQGFDAVIPTVIRGGKAVPFTDWKTVNRGD